MRLLYRILTILSLGLFTSVGAEPLAVDATTLTGKVMCGYQGWFNCEGDGAELGWTHWARHGHLRFGPENVTVDLWPDVSEFDADELFPTGFQMADGSNAKVFSSHNRKTVMRHFKWMQDYGIDGAFLQRFANGIDGNILTDHKDAVLSHVREGSEKFGRAYAIMYDLSGIKRGETSKVKADWLRLRSEQVTNSSSYLHHEGKPLVSIWGVGFSDNRDYTLAECRDLIEFLKAEGCAVMVGVPFWWRDGGRDSVVDPERLKILELADVISPWSVARYHDPEQVKVLADRVLRHDLSWCQDREIDFLPVVFPGFSWFNLHGDEMNKIPRVRGEFFWSQIIAAKSIGCEMIYVAMFDEVDEGTAIFKCTNDVPVGEGVSFLGLEGLPSDYYLRLAGAAGKLLRGEIPADSEIPKP